jgi:hypothetical protein
MRLHNEWIAVLTSIAYYKFFVIGTPIAPNIAPIYYLASSSPSWCRVDAYVDVWHSCTLKSKPDLVVSHKGAGGPVFTESSGVAPLTPTSKSFVKNL